MGLLPTYLNDIFVTKSLKYNLRTENNIPNFNTNSGAPAREARQRSTTGKKIW